ncbi:ABC transporter permease, partial [Streptomyces rubiginosohelvolus]
LASLIAWRVGIWLGPSSDVVDAAPLPGGAAAAASVVRNPFAALF